MLNTRRKKNVNEYLSSFKLNEARVPFFLVMRSCICTSGNCTSTLCLRFRETFLGSCTFIYLMREMEESLQCFVLSQVGKVYKFRLIYLFWVFLDPTSKPETLCPIAIHVAICQIKLKRLSKSVFVLNVSLACFVFSTSRTEDSSCWMV